NGFFSPRFTCFGPEIGVCAPGVAVLSSVPPNNFAVWDGTSMAAPHVTGLAALVLAHHADFQGPFKARSAERVERLYQILKASAQPLNVGDPRRTGFGMPDTLVALGLQPRPAMATVPASLAPQLFDPGSGMALGAALGGIGHAIAATQQRFAPLATGYFGGPFAGPATPTGPAPAGFGQLGGMVLPFELDPVSVAYLRSFSYLPFSQGTAGLAYNQLLPFVMAPSCR